MDQAAMDLLDQATLNLIISNIPNFVFGLIAVATLVFVVIRQQLTISKMGETFAEVNKALSNEIIDWRRDIGTGAASLLIEPPIAEDDTLILE